MLKCLRGNLFTKKCTYIIEWSKEVVCIIMYKLYILTFIEIQNKNPELARTVFWCLYVQIIGFQATKHIAEYMMCKK